MDTLKERGFGEPQTKIIIENAGANKAKAAELVQKFAAAKMDLIFTVRHLCDHSRRPGD